MKKFAIASLLFCISISLMSQRTPQVRQRQANQQARVQQGVNSGQITPKEEKKLQAQQAKIQHDKKQAKADGIVDARERAKLHREQERANKKIYKEKHDAQHR